MAAISAAANVSIGWDAAEAGVRTRAVQGRLGIAAALRRALAGSGYRAVPAGPGAFRITAASAAEARPAATPSLSPSAPSSLAEGSASSGELIVTGQKRAQILEDVPMSLSRVDLVDADLGQVAAGSQDLSLGVEGLALTNLGPGRNRQFIRGVADSPFNGTSQSTVAVQLDEARITYDAPDPDLHLIDMARIEVLKGPQGALYGSAALGGIYHVVTRRPVLDDVTGSLRITGEAVEHGGPGGGVEGVVNLPIVEDRLAVRAVGYLTREGGWIDNDGGRQNANATVTHGGRLGLRWRNDAGWTLDLSGILQDVNSRDSQYVTGADDTLKRAARIAEPADNDFKSAAATLRGQVGGLDLLATSSYVDHRVNSVLDSSDASSRFGLSGASRFIDDRAYTVANGEIRLSPAGSSRWVVGASALRATSRDTGTIQGATSSVVAENLDRRATELALFGEGTLPLWHGIDATAGARLFRSIADDEALEKAGGTSNRFARMFVSPSLALSWSPHPHSLIYLRYAEGLRPGGLAPVGETRARRFDSDELGTLDLGYRGEPIAGRLTVGASLFHTVWSHIQTDYLLANGLVATRNAGRGRINGIEASADWRPAPRWQVQLGATYVRALLVDTEDGAKLDDRRLPVTPDVTARAALRYTVPVGDWTARFSAQARYVGPARLSFDEDLDRKMGNYGTAAATAFFTRGGLTIGARVDNLLDINGDTFAFGNPFSIRSARQYTPLRPRTITLSVARSW
jgi:iron complex outermembrane receptor protein